MKEKLTLFFQEHKIASLVGLGVLMVAVVITTIGLSTQKNTRSNASTSPVSLSFSPATGTYPISDTPSVDVMMDTGGNDVTGADITVQFSQSTLGVINFAPSSQFQTIVNGPAATGAGTGTYRFVLVNITATPITGQVKLGTFLLRTRLAGTGTLSFGSPIQITAAGTTTALSIGSQTGGAYTITECNNESGCNQTETPSTTGSPTPSIPSQCRLCQTLGRNFVCTSSQRPDEPQCSLTDYSAGTNGAISCSSCTIVSASPSPLPTSTTTPSTVVTVSSSPSPSPSLQPTTTGSMTLTMTLALQALGNTGTNTSPIGGNVNPNTTSRSVKVQLFDQNDVAVGETGVGTVTYNATTKLFTGAVSLNAAPGQYTIKIVTDRYLRKRVAGFQNLVAGNNTVPQTTLIAGDVNGDNQINILDYNIISDCFNGKFASTACTTHPEHAKADVNDDGAIDGIDYNIFISNLSSQNGD